MNRWSRYRDVPEQTYEAEERRIVYRARRWIGTEPPKIGGRVTVEQSDRLDLIAQRTLGGVQNAWRLADANPSSLHPFELIRRRRTLDVPEA